MKWDVWIHPLKIKTLGTRSSTQFVSLKNSLAWCFFSYTKCAIMDLKIIVIVPTHHGDTKQTEICRNSSPKQFRFQPRPRLTPSVLSSSRCEAFMLTLSDVAWVLEDWARWESGMIFWARKVVESVGCLLGVFNPLGGLNVWCCCFLFLGL